MRDRQWTEARPGVEPNLRPGVIQNRRRSERHSIDRSGFHCNIGRQSLNLAACCGCRTRMVGAHAARRFPMHLMSLSMMDVRLGFANRPVRSSGDAFPWAARGALRDPTLPRRELIID